MPAEVPKNTAQMNKIRLTSSIQTTELPRTVLATTSAKTSNSSVRTIAPHTYVSRSSVNLDFNPRIHRIDNWTFPAAYFCRLNRVGRWQSSAPPLRSTPRSRSAHPLGCTANAFAPFHVSPLRREAVNLLHFRNSQDRLTFQYRSHSANFLRLTASLPISRTTRRIESTK